MDFGIAGRKALVCAASKGLGRGCAQALAEAGCDVTIVARTEDALRRTAEDLGARAGRTVHFVACDITTPEGRAAALAACSAPDILVNNAGGPPPGDFRDWDRAAWIRGARRQHADADRAHQSDHRQNDRAASSAASSTSPRAQSRRRSTSSGCRMARASGLTGFVAGVARKVARHNVTINNLLPGSFDTDRLRTTMAARARQPRTSRSTKSLPQRARRIPRRALRDDRANSAPRALSCAACTRVSSSARTSSSTAARIPELSDP